MKHTAIWMDDLKKEEIKKIPKEMTVDVLIIGAGLSGLSCAYHLKDKKKKVAVIEKQHVGEGITC